MSKLVHIPKIGHIEFPDEMDDQAIGKAASNLHSNARAQAISKFMGEDPTIQGLPHSQKLKELSAIATLMEKYPRLADAVDKGITSQTDEQPNESPTQAAPSTPPEQPSPSSASD